MKTLIVNIFIFTLVIYRQGFAFTSNSFNVQDRITYKVTGKIFNQKNKKPIAGVKVLAYKIFRKENGEIESYRIEKNTHFALSKIDGQFNIDLYAETEYVILCNYQNYVAEKIWFDKKDVVDGEYISIEVPMWEGSIVAVTGRCIDKVARQSLSGVIVSLVNISTGVSKVLNTWSDGKYYFILEKGQEYTIEGTKSNYFLTKGSKVSTKRVVDKVFSRNLEMEEIKVGKKFIIQNFFHPHDDKISDKGSIELNEIIRLLQENKGFTVEISCHTDSRGDDNFNLKISQKRADSIITFLVDNGVSALRVTAKGYGESKLLNKCANGVKCETSKHEDNRRIEVTIMDILE